MSESNTTAPAVTLNDQTLHDHPLTTEEPIHNSELRENIDIINDVNPEDNQVPLAIIQDKQDPNLYIPGSNSASDDEVNIEEEIPEIIVDQDTKKKHRPVSMILLHRHSSAAETVITTVTAVGALDISPISLTDNKKDDTDDDDTDDELMRITEANRFISLEQPKETNDTALKNRTKSLRSQSVATRRNLLVFADNPTVVKNPIELL